MEGRTQFGSMYDSRDRFWYKSLSQMSIFCPKKSVSINTLIYTEGVEISEKVLK
jgi:hypothetical protein